MGRTLTKKVEKATTPPLKKTPGKKKSVALVKNDRIKLNSTIKDLQKMYGISLQADSREIIDQAAMDVLTNLIDEVSDMSEHRQTIKDRQAICGCLSEIVVKTKHHEQHFKPLTEEFEKASRIYEETYPSKKKKTTKPIKK